MIYSPITSSTLRRRRVSIKPVFTTWTVMSHIYTAIKLRRLKELYPKNCNIKITPACCNKIFTADAVPDQACSTRTIIAFELKLFKLRPLELPALS